MSLRLLSAVLFAALVPAPGCDHGLVPPEAPPTGHLRAVIAYDSPWPPADSLFDLRFVAMRFVPQDTADLLQLNRIAFSERLPYFVVADTVLLAGIDAGAYVYSGVAQNYAQDLFSWRPVGLYEADGGVFQVRAGETTDVAVRVDFQNPPPFPPPAVE